MAITQNTFNGDGSNLGPFSFTFKWLRASDIKVTVNNVLKTAGTHYNLQSLNYTTKTGGEVLFTAGNAPPVGTSNIRVYRDTDDSTLVATFSSGSAIRAADLNSNFTQELYRVQETTNYSVQDIGSVTLAATYTFTYSPSGPTPTSSAHLATKGYVDGVAFASGNLTVGDKGDITVNSATSWTINNLAITTGKLADSAVTALKIANSTITTAKLANGTARQLLQTNAAGNGAEWTTNISVGSITGTSVSATTISDSIGNIRNIPQNSQSSAYTLIASDTGKHISITTGGVTVPSGVFNIGDIVTVYNNSSSAQTITQGASTTIRLGGSTTTGSRTLAQYGLATLLCVASNVFICSGPGVS